MFHRYTRVFNSLGLALFLTFLAVGGLDGQVVNPHASEKIGTVQQVYDGALLPDIQVHTFRNIDRLFPTRTVKHGTHTYPLPVNNRPLKNFQFKSDGKEYDLYDYLSLNRVSGLLVLKDGKVAYETYQ